MREHDPDITAGRIRALIAEQASDWLIRLEDPNLSVEERSAFSDWLIASPAHVSEFLDARATWEILMGRAFDHLPDDATLLREASAATAAEILPLQKQPAARPRRPVFAIAASITGVALVAGVIWWMVRPLDPSHAIYTTAAGEQITHQLPDGSSIALNTRSRVRMDWSTQYRDIHLESGEALFQVARDPWRPFRVWVGSSLVRAVGTRFNVYRTDQRIVVTVLEGRVEVKKDTAAKSGGALLDAGEQARIEPQAPLQAHRIASPDSVTAWQSSRLIFDGEPLTQVVSEFNRYHDVPLVIEDATLGAKRIHGVFDATDRASLITFLEDTDQVQVERQEKRLLIRRRW